MKETFEMYAARIQREGIQDLLEYLDQSGFYKTPASTQYHLNSEGGLAEHSVNVVKIALYVNEVLGRAVDEESLTLVSLFHDVGKHEVFGKKYYTENILKSGKQSKAKPYSKNKELLNFNHEISSLLILNEFIELTEDETWAILQHNGMYSDLRYQLRGNETPLQMILHFADMWASRVIEVEK